MIIYILNVSVVLQMKICCSFTDEDHLLRAIDFEALTSLSARGQHCIYCILNQHKFKLSRYFYPYVHKQSAGFEPLAFMHCGLVSLLLKHSWLLVKDVFNRLFILPERARFLASSGLVAAARSATCPRPRVWTPFARSATSESLRWAGWVTLRQPGAPASAPWAWRGRLCSRVRHCSSDPAC